MDPGTATASIAASFAAWALLHSTLAGSRAKQAARLAWGPRADRWYRIAYNAVALLTFAGIVALVYRLPDRVLYAAPTALAWALRAVQGAAAVAALLTARLTGTAELLGLSQPDRAPRLAVSGPYRYVRHPLYSLSLVLMAASPGMTRNTAVLFALMGVYFYIGSVHEERGLARLFGDAYARYRGQVPRLVPWPGRVYRGAATPSQPAG
jgi:methanethiol S-methyltransferase